jgi:hypothetical protein
MQKIPALSAKRQRVVEPKTTHFSLPGLLSGQQKLALNPSTRTLSLLSDGPELLHEQQFSLNELRVLTPILEVFPQCCPYEVLLAYISSNTVTTASIARCHERLQEAREDGRWHQELRPIRRALSSLRTKLHPFHLEISNVRERGCSLTSLQTHTV